MTKNQEPMIKLEPNGKAPVLSYNIPEPTSYSGRNLIELKFLEEYFKKEFRKKPSDSERTSVSNLDIQTVKTAVVNGMKSGFSDSKLFPNIKLTTGSIRLVEKTNPGTFVVSDIPVSQKLAQIDPEEVAYMMQSGKRLNIYKTLYGTLTYNYLPEPIVARPRIYLVETYRLSSYLGSYGAGRTIKTFSLLPGEKTKISIKSYTKSQTDSKSASSILDSFTEESANDFENSMQNEQSDKQNSAESFEYHTEAEASASWGFGSAHVEGGVKGGSNSAREEFAKNVSSATEKHTAKASAKRDVQINTSYEVKEESGEETSIEREIQNINLSRTLNFVFRQINQEFITILHLVDVRVGFFNGFAETKREVTLPEINSLLEEVLVDEDKIQKVREAIIDQLKNIFDYKDNHHSFIEEKTFKDSSGNIVPNSSYLRVKKDYISTYNDETTGTEISVPGIIMAANKRVMRTEGVIVEALLGEGESLDGYAKQLQDLEIKKRDAEVDKLKAEADREKLINKIVQDNDRERAEVLGALISAYVCDDTCTCDGDDEGTNA